MTWLDKLLESSEEEVDEVIQNGIDAADAQGIEDVNHASTDVLDPGVSADPDKLTYDDNCYSQDKEMGSEKVAGTVDAQIGDTKTTVASGNPTKPTTESFIDADDMRELYAECVAELISENTDRLNEMYKQKMYELRTFAEGYIKDHYGPNSGLGKAIGRGAKDAAKNLDRDKVEKALNSKTARKVGKKIRDAYGKAYDKMTSENAMQESAQDVNAMMDKIFGSV